MSTLLLTPRHVTCGAVYEQLMNKKFQQGSFESSLQCIKDGCPLCHSPPRRDAIPTCEQVGESTCFRRQSSRPGTFVVVMFTIFALRIVNITTTKVPGRLDCR